MTDLGPAFARELRFRLPGRWFRIDVTTDATADASAREMAEALVGAGDDVASIRIRIREQVRRAVDEGREGSLRAMYLASELAPGVPLPMALTVFEPSDLRIASAVGQGPEAVAAALKAALVEIEVEGIQVAAELDCRAFRAIRTTRVDTENWSPTVLDGGEERDRYPFAYSAEAAAESRQVTQRRLRVQYWCTVPDSKQVVLAVLSTPLGDIPETMLRLSDAIIRAATFADRALPESVPTEDHCTSVG